MTVPQAYNAFEAALWIAIGLGFLWDRSRAPERRSRISSPIAGAVFLAFGVSDIVEFHTGAWWRPWWLLVWKAAIVIYLVFFFRQKLSRPK